MVNMDDAETRSADGTTENENLETKISNSPGFTSLLRKLDTSLVFSSYYSGNLYFVG